MLIVVEYVTKVRKNSKFKLDRRNSAIQNLDFVSDGCADSTKLHVLLGGVEAIGK